MKSLYVWIHGECTRYRRDEKGRLHADFADDLPETFFEDAHEGVTVFEGTVHQTRGLSDDEREALDLPSDAANYDEWWSRQMRAATDAEILAVFAAAPEGTR